LKVKNEFFLLFRTCYQTFFSKNVHVFEAAVIQNFHTNNPTNLKFDMHI